MGKQFNWKGTIISGLIIAVFTVVAQPFVSHYLTPLIAELPQVTLGAIPELIIDEWPTFAALTALSVLILVFTVSLWKAGFRFYSVTMLILLLITVVDVMASIYLHHYEFSRPIAGYIFYVIISILASVYFLLRFGLVEDRWVRASSLIFVLVLIGYFFMPAEVEVCTPWLNDRIEIRCPSWYRAIW